MGFFSDFDKRMIKVVQESPALNPSISSGKRKMQTKRRVAQKCCLLSLLVAPLLLVLFLMQGLSTYNDWMRIYEQGDMDVAKKSMLRSENNAVAKAGSSASKGENTLVLTTKHGPIRITLRPDLSDGSVDYIHRLVENGTCQRCQFYRAEKPGILQGVMANKKDVPVNTVKGSCPDGLDSVANDCPEWDAQCSCHGPIMTKGAVAWAAGQAGGPDFFIDNYPKPARFWGTQHTNFGRVADEASLQVIASIFELPVNSKGGMHYLEDKISFEMSLENNP